MYKTCYLLVFIVGFLGNPLLVSASSDITGAVRTINVNKTWGGIFIQLENAPIFELGSTCESLWAFVPISDEYAKHFVSVAMTAKATNEIIRISTSGCISTPAGPAPKIEWIDYGLRIN